MDVSWVNVWTSWKHCLEGALRTSPQKARHMDKVKTVGMDLKHITNNIKGLSRHDSAHGQTDGHMDKMKPVYPFNFTDSVNTLLYTNTWNILHLTLTSYPPVIKLTMDLKRTMRSRGWQIHRFVQCFLISNVACWRCHSLALIHQHVVIR